MGKFKQQFLRALFKFYTIRVFFIFLYNQFRKNPRQNAINNFSSQIKSNEIVNEVNRNGFSSVFQMNPDLLTDLIKECSENDCFVGEAEPYRINVQNPVNPNEKYIRYTYKNALAWPSIKNVVYNDTFLNIARGYLGNEPVIQNVSVWWSFEKQESMKTNIYNFHYDIDNMKFIKLFTYLTNVDENNGPHIIYPKTHKFKTILQKRYRSVPDEKVSSVLGNRKPTVLVGKSGTSFFEDTFSYHKGLNPVKPRLIFQVEYSLTTNKLG